MQHLLFVAFLLLTSTVFAFLEIQIEGKYGWAAKLPTWRIPVKPKRLLAFLVDPNQPRTGYHTYLWSFIVATSHFVFLLSPWSLQREFYVLSYCVLLTVVADFLWFAFNPYYGLKKFKKGEIPWHTYWFLGVPRVYWVGYPVGILFYLIGSGVI